ncbi:MAG TPA: hypothetical protein VJ987_01785, partial [Anaerolineales bacterium]|nr:hypothetical protein [Anaerolineales bacterium]
MAGENVQAVLDRILRELKSEDKERELAAIQELETVNFSSEAVVSQLEKLALRNTGNIRDAALRALSFKTSQFVSSKRSPLNRSSRAIILREIETWQDNGLLDSHQATVFKRRYDFDIQPGITTRPTTPQPEEKQIVEKKEPAQAVVSKPAPVSEQQPPAHLAKPAAPRPSLTQILLSENSIRIYLYLGAFFVIASAAILAAVIEAARLPILLVATLIFAGGAVGLKKRLPQPSFALAVVFSFLLPIDANVIADSLNLSLSGNHFYWAGLFFLMTGIWGFGTWFYESSMFSLAAFLSLILGILRFDNAINLSNDWTVFTLGVATFIGLVFVRMLQNWKDKKFARPIFITAQILQAIVLLMSLSYIGFNLFGSDAPSNAWIAHTLTWLLAASFFATSNILVPFVLFPWMAVASLFLIPWMFLSAFDASSSLHIAGFVTWGALAAFTSELAQRGRNKSLQQYSTPLLAISLLLFAVAFFGGAIENAQHAFAVLLSIGAVYTGVNLFRPRWYVWSVALLSWLGAFFLFFELPFMQKAEVYFGYQLLVASVVLLLPELSMTKPLTFKRTWNWPPVAIGTLLVALNILLAHIVLIDSDANFGRAAITLGVYALLFAASAIHFKQPLLGYLSTTSLALTVVYSLVHFDLDLWLPSLTALSVVYYFAGYFLRRNEQNKNWGAMLINSGLALGVIFSIFAVLSLKATGGWYALVIGALFIIEMFIRRNGYLEFFAVSLFSIAFVIILNDFKVYEFSYYLYGLSLIWLASDAILHRTFDGRKTEIVTRVIGGLATFAFAMEVTTNYGLASASASACFAVYTVFFAAYAFAYRKSELGYLSTASAA